MTWISGSVGVEVLPRPLNEPPKTMLPAVFLAMEDTAPLNPAKGKFVHPVVQASAFVELPPMKDPPT